MIGGFFNFAAALYYTTQVFRVSQSSSPSVQPSVCEDVYRVLTFPAIKQESVALRARHVPQYRHTHPHHHVRGSHPSLRYNALCRHCADLNSVAVTGFKVPTPEMATLNQFKDFNQFRVPFFKAWGVVALLGDAAICISSELSHHPTRLW